MVIKRFVVLLAIETIRIKWKRCRSVTTKGLPLQVSTRRKGLVIFFVTSILQCIWSLLRVPPHALLKDALTARGQLCYTFSMIFSSEIDWKDFLSIQAKLEFIMELDLYLSFFCFVLFFFKMGSNLPMSYLICFFFHTYNIGHHTLKIKIHEFMLPLSK